MHVDTAYMLKRYEIPIVVLSQKVHSSNRFPKYETVAGEGKRNYKSKETNKRIPL